MSDAEVVEMVPSDSADGQTPPHPRWYRRWFTYDFAGIIGALVFVFLSATPSLIPRSALFQGLVAGAAAGSGGWSSSSRLRPSPQPVGGAPGR
jgi:uncharacterized membrane protein